MAVTTQSIVAQFMDALALPLKNCTSLVIEFKPNDVVRVKAEYMPTMEQMSTVETLIRELKAEPKS